MSFCDRFYLNFYLFSLHMHLQNKIPIFTQIFNNMDIRYFKFGQQVNDNFE